MIRAALTALGVIAGIEGGTSTAHANGAFPAPFRIFVPAGRPDDVTVTANFGLIATRDAGKTWVWTCEHGEDNGGYLYQQAITGGAGRILGLASNHLVLTDDDACDWSVSAGFPTTESIDDSFIDPSRATHLLAIGHHGTGAAAVFELFASEDAGTTFRSAPLYATQPGIRLDSVEIARSNPARVYLTTSPFTANGDPSRVLRSDDGGKTFVLQPTDPTLGAGILLIAGVDPERPDELFFRFIGTDDRLLISTDAGATMRVALIAEPGRQLTAFLRRANGNLLAATFDSISGNLFRSMDGGDTFSTLSPSLHVGSLAERDGVLYVLADGINDGFLVGVSRDGGDTVEPYLDLSAVRGVQMCGTMDLRKECAASCMNLMNADLFSATVCDTLVATNAAAATPAPSSEPGAGCGACAMASIPGAEASGPLIQICLILVACSTRPRSRMPSRS